MEYIGFQICPSRVVFGDGDKTVCIRLVQNGGIRGGVAGVNDVLALKESDCSVVMASGSDAAKSVGQLVLLDSNFASMPKIVAEGRQTINNVERSASLLLVKTLYTIMLIIYSIISFQKYLFIPIQKKKKTQCVFYTYSTSQVGLVTFQGLSVRLGTTTLDSIALWSL